MHHPFFQHTAAARLAQIPSNDPHSQIAAPQTHHHFVLKRIRKSEGNLAAMSIKEAPHIPKPIFRCVCVCVCCFGVCSVCGSALYKFRLAAMSIKEAPHIPKPVFRCVRLHVCSPHAVCIRGWGVYAVFNRLVHDMQASSWEAS